MPTSDGDRAVRCCMSCLDSIARDIEPTSDAPKRPLYGQGTRCDRQLHLLQPKAQTFKAIRGLAGVHRTNDDIASISQAISVEATLCKGLGIAVDGDSLTRDRSSAR